MHTYTPQRWCPVAVRTETRFKHEPGFLEGQQAEMVLDVQRLTHTLMRLHSALLNDGLWTKEMQAEWERAKVWADLIKDQKEMGE